MNWKDVPCTQSSFAPTGPSRRHWMNVQMPETKSAMEIMNAFTSPEVPNAEQMMIGGVMMPTKIASRCWSAANSDSKNGGLSSMP